MAESPSSFFSQWRSPHGLKAPDYVHTAFRENWIAFLDISAGSSPYAFSSFFFSRPCATYFATFKLAASKPSTTSRIAVGSPCKYTQDKDSPNKRWKLENSLMTPPLALFDVLLVLVPLVWEVCISNH